MDKNEIAKRFTKYLEDNDITQQTVADAAGISQSFVSRIKTGDFKRITDKVKRVCEYASIDLSSAKEKPNPANNPDIMEAIKEVWDGTDKKAKALAKVISSLKELSA